MLFPEVLPAWMTVAAGVITAAITWFVKDFLVPRQAARDARVAQADARQALIDARKSTAEERTANADEHIADSLESIQKSVAVISFQLAQIEKNTDGERGRKVIAKAQRPDGTGE